MAERKFNSELRIQQMISFQEALVVNRCAPLPADWLEMSLVRIANENGADGFLPIRYKARDEFFNLTDSWAYGYYTIEGPQIYFGGAPDDVEGIEYKISYYAKVPTLSDTQASWVYEQFPDLYLTAALMWAALHAVGEEQSAANFKAIAEDTILKLNAAWLRSKASGSRVTRSRIRSFG